MSEQTTEAAMDASEPSMEDILASIRKIIADDDAPDASAADTSIDTMDIGNVSDLVSTSDEMQISPNQTPNQPSGLQLESYDNQSASVDDATQSDEILDETVGLVEEPEAELDSAQALRSDEVMGDLLADMTTTEDIISDDVLSDNVISNDSELDELKLDEMPLPDASLSNASLLDIGPAVITEDSITGANLIDFDVDGDLADTVDLEIPMPDPSEAITGDGGADEIVTRPGIPDIDAQDIAAVDLDAQDIDVSNFGSVAGGAAALGAVTAGAAKAIKTEMRADTEPAIIDDELTALLDEDILVAEPTGLSADDLSIVEDNVSDMADTLSPDMDALDDDSLDMDVNAALGIEDSPATEIDTPEDSSVTDDELDALLADMDLEQDDLETSDAAREVDSEEDADLLLVKSLMADLADYDTDTELVTDEDMSDDMSSSVEPAEDIMDAPSLSDIPNDIEADDDAILDEILDLALEDELQSAAELDAMGADDVAALELENLAENAKLDALLSDVPFDDVNALEIDDAVSDMPSAMTDETPTDNGAMSLSDIAAAAQADADAAETVSAVRHSGLGAILAGVGGTAIAGGAAFMAQADEAKIDAAEIDTSEVDTSEVDALALTQFEDDDVQTDNSMPDDVEQMLSKLLDDEVSTTSEDLNDDIPEDERFDLEGFAPSSDIEENLTHDVREEATDAPESHKLKQMTQEITDMPRAAAKNTDIIMDDVTETATASVFAELNQVVEEKAIVAERGDRIGDLVMEALRPMLKDWLDANLKGIVERAVAKEVKRISSGK